MDLFVRFQRIRQATALSVLTLTFAIAAPPASAANEELVAAAEETLEFVEETLDATGKTEEQLTTIATLVADIERARTDPGALSGDKYADLFVRIVMLVPDNIELPEVISRTIGLAATGIGALFGAATEMGLQDVRFRFNKHMDTLSGTRSERLLGASRLVSSVVQIQHWAILDWLGRQPRPMGEITWSRNATDLRGRNGEVFEFACPPRGDQGVGTVWGTDIYTDDSSICRAATHVGVITEAAGGVVRIEILPGRDGYPASERNGVQTNGWGSWSGSYRIIVRGT